MKILFIGEIVGKAGVFAVKNILSKLKEEESINFTIANANGVTGGYGLGKNHSIYLRKLGIDVLTGGECIYYKKDLVQHISHAPYILRPANYPSGNPGRGWGLYEEAGYKIGVINLMGLSGFERTHLNNPFTYITEIIKKVSLTTPVIVLQFHARTTAEKRTMACLVDGQVSAVIGSGGRVMTSDAGISEKGTAMINDTGRTGSFFSVGGMDPEVELEQLLTQVPGRSKEAWNKVEFQGILMDIGSDGKAVSIDIIKRSCEAQPNEPDSDSPED